MKKRFFLLLLLAIVAIAAEAKSHRYKGRVLECISGNCVNGDGVASVTMNSNYENDKRNILHYTGQFKDGLMDGKGAFYKTSSDLYVAGEKTKIYVGHFSEGELDGYFTTWLAKAGTADAPVPDSSERVCFFLYDEGIVREGIDIAIDGSTENRFGNKDYVNGHSVPGKEIKDEHLKALVAAYIASRKNKFAPVGTPTATPVLLVRKTFTVQRGKSVMFTDYACLTDRKYFVTAGSRAKGNQMPFAGSVIYQVQSDDNKVVFEAAADTYWTPQKQGHYTFVILYDQKEAYGNGTYLVDLLTLECTLQSRSLF